MAIKLEQVENEYLRRLFEFASHVPCRDGRGHMISWSQKFFDYYCIKCEKRIYVLVQEARDVLRRNDGVHGETK